MYFGKIWSETLVVSEVAKMVQEPATLELIEKEIAARLNEGGSEKERADLAGQLTLLKRRRENLISAVEDGALSEDDVRSRVAANSRETASSRRTYRGADVSKEASRRL